MSPWHSFQDSSCKEPFSKEMNESRFAVHECLQSSTKADRANLALGQSSVYRFGGDGVASGWTRLNNIKIDKAAAVLGFLMKNLTVKSNAPLASIRSIARHQARHLSVRGTRKVNSSSGTSSCGVALSKRSGGTGQRDKESSRKCSIGKWCSF